ncbi:uncharacterized protein B0H64DRAFT_426130 [Chaetomium fimeti]|uniref:Glycosyl transferase CAP10 domain-containing protein n=1 Tax=Chaetomium fimeti TaxID=1854472 RepID=A0AAE0HBN6_9PEZI|nr:hypothetical protein B0H64DRAFT_426130 [Chaetomium fimeti]
MSAPRRHCFPWASRITTTITTPMTTATTAITAIIDPAVATTAAAALCAVATHRLGVGASPSAHIRSELVCWALLRLLVAGLRRWGSRRGGDRGEVGEGWELVDGGESAGEGGSEGGSRSPSARAASGWSVSVVALALAVVSGFAAEVGVLVLFPVLTPLVLVADRKLRPEIQASESRFAALANSVWGTALVALVAVSAAVRGSSLETLLLIIPLVALLVVYVALIPRTVDGPRLLPYIPDLEEAIPVISTRVWVLFLGMLGIQVYMFGIHSIELGFTPYLLGLVKAGFWYFAIQTARHTSWCTVTAIGTFGLVASRDPWVQISELEALSPVIASILVLAQIILMVPKRLNGRLILWTLFLVSVGPYLANVVAIQRANYSAVHAAEHPVEVLMRVAKAEFDQLLERQSKTYTAAVKEYQRRYGVEPPPGFKEWYEYAVDNQSPIIDEFDMIYESVSPFWRISGKEVVQIMNAAHQTPDIDLWLCSFSGATAETRCEHPTRYSDRHTGDMFNKLLGDIKGLIPDAKFLVNHLDEPRVLISPGADSSNPFSVIDLSEQPTWKAITKFCPSKPQEGHENPLETLGLPFVTNLTTTLDLCNHPEYAHMHGLFQAPPSFKLIEGLVPVLSTGAPSTMSDILLPSPAYIVEPQFHYNPTSDPPWPAKSNHLYWAGSTTGAVASDSPPNNWQTFHRQRFLTLAQNLAPSNHHPHTYLHQTRGATTQKLTTAQSTFLNPRHYAVAPTRIFQCTTPLPCRQQQTHFRRLPWQASDAALGAKLAFDLDGNGISGRFYKLLASRSLVLKQTVLREWHDERLRPWVHYVPVSLGMGEVPEVVEWFLGSGRGGERARELGEAGREWFGRAMREVDPRIIIKTEPMS